MIFHNITPNRKFTFMKNQKNVLTGNVFNYKKSEEVQVEAILNNNVIKLERIVARGQASKAGLFCPQTDNDFLIQLKGDLQLEYQGQKKLVNLVPGEYKITTPNENNRIQSTSKGVDSVWLKASFYGSICQGSFKSPDLRAIKEQMANNVFDNTALIESLIETKDVRIERVASRGQASKAGASCPQDFNEFLVVLEGSTVLEVGDQKYKMGAGDYIIIPPKTQNRVAATTDTEETVWLAIYYPNDEKGGRYPFSTGY